MKKIQILLIGLMFAMPCCVSARNYIYGDVNGDGEVNVSDVNAVVGVILGDYHPDTSLVGSWLSEYAVYDDGDRFNIPTEMCVSFTFDEDQTGTWGCYVRHSNPDSSYYSISYTQLRWEKQANRLAVWFDDGYHEEMYYGFNEDGYLLLSLDAKLTNYTAYRPVETRYPLGLGKPGKD